MIISLLNRRIRLIIEKILELVQKTTIGSNKTALDEISQKKGESVTDSPFNVIFEGTYFTASTTALKALGSFIARSASAFLLISIPFAFNLPMNTE